MKLSSIIKAACLSTLPSLAIATTQPPNVLLIIADDMGLDASNCYSVGQQQAKMPNIKALCEQSMVFENAYSAPVCSPTRATIMTGEYGFRTGVGAAIPRTGGIGLSVNETSLFDQLENSHYSANLLGKWHLGDSEDSLNQPAQLGVPDYFGIFKGGVQDYYHWTAVTQGKQQKVDEYSTTTLTNDAIDWIEEQKNPWFLWLAYNAPHTPFHLPPANLHTAGELATDKQTIKKNPLPYYNAMLEALDSEVGRLLESIPDNVRKKTVVMFIGDNGSPNQVARHLYGKHAAKGSIYEGGTHVPFIVNGPNISAGTNTAFVNTTDLFATIAGYANMTVNTPDSYDFRDVLEGGKSKRDYIYVEHFSDLPPRGPDIFGWALREGDYKLVHPKNGKAELYNIPKDPFEKNDLLADGTSPQESTVIASIQARYELIHQP